MDLDKFFTTIENEIIQEEIYRSFEHQWEEYNKYTEEERAQIKAIRKQIQRKIMNNTITEQEIEENMDLVDWFLWKLIWENVKVSENFIENHSDKIMVNSWFDILVNNDLSEPFLEKHADDMNKFYWDEIFEWQPVSKRFCRKHIDKIKVESLRANTKIKQKEYIDIYVALALLGKTATD